MSGKRWGKEEVQYLVENYTKPDVYAKDISKALGISISRVYDKAMKMGLKAPKCRICNKEEFREGAKKSQFKKGHIPANKGKTLSDVIKKKIEHTFFKKGATPHNYRPVGSERIDRDGYVWVKVADPKVWKQKHRLLWEEHYGKIPRGYNIQFKNKDKHDVRIENLYLISRKEQMGKENSFLARYPKELADVIRLKGAVTRQIHKYQNNHEQ